jgi:hypothetical protein
VLETLEAMARLGSWPRSLCVLGAEPATLEPGLELSPCLCGARDRLVELLLAELGNAPDGVVRAQDRVEAEGPDEGDRDARPGSRPVQRDLHPCT